MPDSPWTVVDLFSGAGGMSYGFHVAGGFQIVGAVDAQVGKPSSGSGSLECNNTYEANLGVTPFDADLATLDPIEYARSRDMLAGRRITVLCSCAPCTGFSRTQNQNHLKDDPRNSLVTRSLDFVRALRPRLFLMENARELIRGRFSHHWLTLERELRGLGYEVYGAVHFLNRFGLPQQRERALVIAAEKSITLRTPDDFWRDYKVRAAATHVRRVISELPPLEAGARHPNDPMHLCSAMGAENSRRLSLIPKDGGSWADLRHHADRQRVLTKAMLGYIARGEFGSHPDVYGRMAWDRPAPTIKRECGHIGNGRYAHPEQDRLCSVREMSLLQGFPKDYVFRSRSITNMYRHIGDAVPPLISYQLAQLCRWMLTGRKPTLPEMVLPGTHLRLQDFRTANVQPTLFAS